MHSRRDILKLGTLGGLSLSIGGLNMITHASPGKTRQADTILRNGRIATLDTKSPFVSAIAVRDGRFVAVGQEKEVMVYRGDKTRMIDLKGRTVIPGLNDSHIHVIRGGLSYNV